MLTPPLGIAFNSIALADNANDLADVSGVSNSERTSNEFKGIYMLLFSRNSCVA